MDAKENPKETFNMGQLTKEMVSARLGEMEDPVSAAAEIMERAMYSALRSARQFGPAEKAMVAEICHGALTGIMLRHQSLSRGSVQILRGVCAVAQRLNLDPTEMMTRAIRGMARIRAVASKDQIHEIVYAVESEFMGAGDRFRNECRDDATVPIQPPMREPKP